MLLLFERQCVALKILALGDSISEAHTPQATEHVPRGTSCVLQFRVTINCSIS